MKVARRFNIGDRVFFPTGSGRVYRIENYRYTTAPTWEDWEYYLPETKQWWRQVLMQQADDEERKKRTRNTKAHTSLLG